MTCPRTGRKKKKAALGGLKGKGTLISHLRSERKGCRMHHRTPLQKPSAIVLRMKRKQAARITGTQPQSPHLSPYSQVLVIRWFLRNYLASHNSRISGRINLVTAGVQLSMRKIRPQEAKAAEEDRTDELLPLKTRCVGTSLLEVHS